MKVCIVVSVGCIKRRKGPPATSARRSTSQARSPVAPSGSARLSSTPSGDTRQRPATASPLKRQTWRHNKVTYCSGCSRGRCPVVTNRRTPCTTAYLNSSRGGICLLTCSSQIKSSTQQKATAPNFPERQRMTQCAMDIFGVRTKQTTNHHTRRINHVSHAMVLR